MSEAAREPAQFFVSVEAFDDWCRRAEKGATLRWGLAGFLPRGNRTAARVRELCEKRLVTTVQRVASGGTDAQGFRKFEYIAQRTGAPFAAAPRADARAKGVLR